MTGPIELAIIIPTLNEAENVRPLVAKLRAALEGIGWEAVFVDDDSGDGTADVVREISRTDRNVRVLQRIGRRGLSSAFMEGVMATAAPYVAVLDGDMQHDETLLPQMLETIRERGLDVVVASRNTGFGSMGDFEKSRVRLSNAGRWISQSVTRVDLQDPMSGYFLADRRFVTEVIRRMSGVSFKILVDMLSSSPRPVRLAEVPYAFRRRVHGESKLDPNTLFEYGILIAHKLIRGVVPIRFALFGAVGLVGVLIHLIILAAMLRNHHESFARAQSVATLGAMTSNFWLNNLFTFRERRLKGWRILTGALTFYVSCAIGGLASVALGSLFFERGVPWYLAGAIGTIVAAVWNFGVTSVFTWPERRAGAQASQTAEAAMPAPGSWQAAEPPRKRT